MAYSEIEDKYLSALTAVQFPDTPVEPTMPEQVMPGRQEGDIMLAEAGSRGLPEQAYSGRYPDTIQSFDPTIKQQMADSLQGVLEKLGTPRAKARADAQSVVGGPSSRLPLSQGIVDLLAMINVPISLAMLPAYTQESYRMGEDAMTSAKRGDYGTAALSAGGAVVGMAPAGQALVQGGKTTIKGVSAAAQKVNEKINLAKKQTKSQSAPKPGAE